MKRSELNVGDELYWAKPHDWRHDYQGRKVVVLSLTPVKWSRRGHHQILESSSGGGVHVKVINPHFTAFEDVALIQHLRGPYEQVKAEVDARRAERRKAEKDAREQADDRRVKTDAVVARAEVAGLGTIRRMPGEPQIVTMAADELTVLLDHLDSLERHVAFGAE